MTFGALSAQAAAQGNAGFRYQQSGRHAFRDRITVYRDGRILFERFCYGEAAGLVFELWGSGATAEGEITWQYETCQNSHKTEAPKRLTGGSEAALLLDEKQTPWERTEVLKSDAAHGYTAAAGLLHRLFGKKR